MTQRILLITICLICLHFFFNHRQLYLDHYNVKYWQREFSRSQTIIGDKAPRILADTELYPIIGYMYVTGLDPSSLQAEVPPLGKQLFGLSILWFKNPLIIQLFLGLASLVLLYLVAEFVLKKSVAALVVVLFQALDPQFQLLLTAGFLDISQLFFLLLSLYFFLRAQRQSHWYLTSVISLGLSMAVKFWLTGLLFLAVYLGYLFIRGNFRLFTRFILYLPGIFLGFCLPYIPTLLKNPNPLDFLRLQSWMVNWWAGNAVVPPGGILKIIFTGLWPTWWGHNELILVREWTPLWPIFTLLAFLSIFKIIIVRNWKLEIRNYYVILIWLQSFAYLVFLCFTSPFPRYLVLLTPGLYLLAIFIFCHSPLFQAE